MNRQQIYTSPEGLKENNDDDKKLLCVVCLAESCVVYNISYPFTLWYAWPKYNLFMPGNKFRTVI